MMVARGIEVSYETIRTRRTPVRARIRQPAAPTSARPGDKWHLDEVFVKIRGVQKYLWRAVDQRGNVLDLLIQSNNPKAFRVEDVLMST